MPDPRTNKVSCSSYQCEIEVTLEVLRGKWKALILWNLFQHKVVRYNELRRLIPSVSQKMLTQQLRDLEDHHLINRQVYNTVPPQVEYKLTEAGLALIPIMETMDQWGKKYVTYYSEKEAEKDVAQ